MAVAATDEKGDGYQELFTLKKSRGGHVSSVSRKYKELAYMLDQRFDIAIVKIKLDEFITAFGKFENIHRECVHLAAELEPDKLTNREEHYAMMLSQKEDILRQFHEFEKFVNDTDLDNIKPSDSVSQHSSHVSSTSSTMARAAAKKAALLAKSEYLDRQQDLARQKLEI
jgi:hypothetical protein